MPVCGELNFEPLFKVKPFVGCVQDTYKALYKPDRYLWQSLKIGHNSDNICQESPESGGIEV